MPDKKKSTSTNSSQRFAIAIMAAGKGTRLKSKRPKVLHEIGGRPLLEHVIRASAQIVPSSDIFAIIGHEADSVRAAVQHTGIGFVVQAEQRGTGHAVMCARSALQNYDHVLVLSGDVPLIRPETIRQLRDFHLQQRASMTILTALPEEPTGYGRVIRKSSRSADVKAIVEQKALNKAQAKTKEINSGIYAFATRDLWQHIDRITTNNAHGEFYLTDMAALLVKAKKKVVALPAADDIEVLGANTLAEMVMLDASMRQQKCSALLANGVTIFRPETCVIDSEVEIGPDTVIEPFVQILGKTRIGQDCRIRSFSVIKDSEIADGVNVKPGCIFDEAKVARGAIIGPYSHLRPGSDIGENAHVGNFVETKKTRLGKGSKANHLTYLGDAEIGEGVNVGAGTITCNYDGVHKHLTRIEDGVFVGSDSTLVAPITIGKGAYIGAASCITEDVPPDSLALGRSKQVVKDGWAKAKREARAAGKK
jgi:bifunctional UDP-N-acetylglucosamine pyrophosphorylase/glucosamine-1-phosphate N-acetyltransferase